VEMLEAWIWNLGSAGKFYAWTRYFQPIDID